MLIGLGWRAELAGDLLARPRAVDFVEVVAEACFVQPRQWREALAIAQMWPVIPHGVKLSLGSAEGIDDARAQRLGRLARELGAPMVSEHVAFTRAGGREIGHLTPLPRTRDAVAVVARNVARARRRLPDVPLLLENVAATLAWPQDAMDEASFYHEIVEATGCELLLDLGNLFANAFNAGIDPLRVMLEYPLERVAMVHIAGGELEDGFWFDTHAGAVHEEVWRLLHAFVQRRPGVPVLLERDANFSFAEVEAELARARALLGVVAAPHEIETRAPTLHHVPSETLAEAQRELALALTDVQEPSVAAQQSFGREALTRSRRVLERKRVDDALPLLPRLAPHAEAIRELALVTVRHAPRAPRAAAIADAMRIANAALTRPELAAAARLDRLVLRARFVGPDRSGAMRGRVGPFLGRTDRTWAVKSIGPAADVHLIERKP